MIFTRTPTSTTPAPRPFPSLEGTGTHAGKACSLTETRVTAGVSGFIAEVRVEQTYVNPFAVNLDTRYTFPLPHDGAVSAFEFTVDGKVIHGEVRERAEARHDFEQARTAGRRAGLVEQETPNVFTLELANIPAGATVKAALTYVEALPYQSGDFCLRFPTVVAPRYTPAGETPGAGAHQPAATVPHTLAMEVWVNAGMAIESWRCETHALRELPCSKGDLRLALASGAPDRDLVLTWRVGGASIRLGLVTHRPDAAQDGAFYMFAVPPADVGSADVRGKEMAFLVDRSGSMGGEKMRQAREALRGCLRALNPADTFSIHAFDDKLERFSERPVAFEQAALEAAEGWLSRVDARGGTDVLPALVEALARPADPLRQRVIVLITDGQVGNEARLLEHVRQRLGGARLFTVGIDTAVNTHLLTKLAQHGKGCAQFVLPTGDIEGVIGALANRIGSPLLTDPVADFGTVRVSDLAPHPLPDVMAGQVVAVAGRYRGHGRTEVVFSGQGPGRLLEHKVEVEFPREDRANPLVDKIWARLLIDRHEDTLLDDPNSPTVKQKIVALAVRHGLLSSQTSFVAIDARDGDPRKAREAISQTVPQALPAGWDRSFGDLATPAAVRGGYAGGHAKMSRASAAPAAPSPRVSHTLYDLGEPEGGSFGSLGRSLGGGASDDLDSFMDCLEAPEPKQARKFDARVEAPDEMIELRDLAKRQRVDGSWNGSVAETAEALSRFVRNGHTDRFGGFTAQVRRAIEFIERALATGWSGTPDENRRLRNAVTALAVATGSAQHQALQARLHA